MKGVKNEQVKNSMIERDVEEAEGRTEKNRQVERKGKKIEN